MKIYTKNGDLGNSNMVGGYQISKSDPVMDAYGTFDELNSCIGIVSSENRFPDLKLIQNQLFEIAGMVATRPEEWEKYWSCVDINSYIAFLEKKIDIMSEQLDPQRNFILPTGSQIIATIHLCRTICRRAERNIAKLFQREKRYLNILKYTNRLSDFLYIMARFEHKKNGIPETTWKSTK